MIGKVFSISLLTFAFISLTDSFALHRQKRSDDDFARCRLLPETGRCLASFRNYYYNTATGDCQTFLYGGCQGNANNFRTREACLEACGNFNITLEEFSLQEEPRDECEYPPEVGECRALVIRYYYNGENCEAFIFGGCGDYPNNFRTKEECLARCNPNTEGWRHRSFPSYILALKKESFPFCLRAWLHEGIHIPFNNLH